MWIKQIRATKKSIIKVHAEVCWAQQTQAKWKLGVILWKMAPLRDLGLEFGHEEQFEFNNNIRMHH